MGHLIFVVICHWSIITQKIQPKFPALKTVNRSWPRLCWMLHLRYLKLASPEGPTAMATLKVPRQQLRNPIFGTVSSQNSSYCTYTFWDTRSIRTSNNITKISKCFRRFLVGLLMRQSFPRNQANGATGPAVLAAAMGATAVGAAARRQTRAA